ncbi:hypothetical protein AB0E25_39170 [Streptomyces bobili]|uniref:hypothetical protein n=1 Tax=Streptomyces bobili TaxID=67280 RepID=UPI0033FB53EC
MTRFSRATSRAFNAYVHAKRRTRIHFLSLSTMISASVMAMSYVEAPGVDSTGGIPYAYIIGSTGLAALVMGPETVPAWRAAARWAAPFVSLVGVLLLVPFATVFPPRRGRRWLGEVLNTFLDRREFGMKFWGVLGSFARNWPADLAGEWVTYLTGPPKELRLETTDGEVAPLPESRSFWQRHRSEIFWGLVFAVLLSLPGALAYEAGTEWMHHHGYQWSWEETNPNH